MTQKKKKQILSSPRNYTKKLKDQFSYFIRLYLGLSGAVKDTLAKTRIRNFSFLSLINSQDGHPGCKKFIFLNSFSKFSFHRIRILSYSLLMYLFLFEILRIKATERSFE